MKFFELQKLLKEEFDIDHLADIARELGVSAQAVSNWKARNKVPYKYVQKIREKINKNPNTKNILLETNFNQNQVDELTTSNYNIMSFIKIFFSLVKHIWIIIITPIIFSVIMVIYVQFIAQPIYTSSAKIMSSSGGNLGGSAVDIAAKFGVDVGEARETQWAIPEIIKSRTLARNMLKRKFNTVKYGQQKTLFEILSGVEDKSIYNEKIIKNAVNSVIGMISIKKTGSYFSLSITGFERIFVRDFAVTLLEELDIHQRKYSSNRIGETRQFIEERISQTEKELHNVEEKLKRFRASNRRIQNSPALQLEQERQRREVQVLTGVFTSLKSQLETTKIEEVRESNYVIVLDPPEVPLYYSSPKKKQSVILACMVGIGLGFFIAFLKEMIERDKENYKEILHLKSQASNKIRELPIYKKIFLKKERII